MASTTIPDVKSALLTLLGTVSALTTPNVDIRYAFSPSQRRDAVWMGETVLSELEPANFRGGRSRRHESFTIALHVQAHGRTPLEAETDAFAYARAIEEALADDPKINDTSNLSWAYVEELEAQTAEADDGPACTIEMTIRCKGNFV